MLDPLRNCYGCVVSEEGSVTIPSNLHGIRVWNLEIDTNGQVPLDDLKVVKGGRTGDILILSILNDARDVRVIDNSPDAEGNHLELASTFTLNQRKDKMLLIKRSSSPDVWDEISRSPN
ncbi:MAG: hypothetical protein GTN64_02475 [Candidatus Latescibacteria bacterium]|nr:hypothetical protein [Candidatus Latescibacterota bacterium]NIO77483.1 hypothetical protein [Candidatus Latescibacterota bacterium]